MNSPLDDIEEALLSMPRHKGDIVDKALGRVPEVRETIDHLKACIEYDNNLQSEVLAVGVQLIDAPRGATICTTRAWAAIQKKLKEVRENEAGVWRCLETTADYEAALSYYAELDALANISNKVAQRVLDKHAETIKNIGGDDE